ncbi:MAG: PEGA domain-containing protein, partial [Deltaproteobacteria bacterium]|nr:PEGA domain-containing protein [Deltaproteobacteria bacterium]
PRGPEDGWDARLAEGEELFHRGDAAPATEALEAGFRSLELHPELLPAAPERRAAVYGSLLVLYRLRTEAGGASEALSEWLAVHLPDQDPTVLRVPPLVEAALSGRRDAVRARTAILTAEVLGPGAWEVYVDGRRLGEAPLRRVEVPAGRHVLELRREGGPGSPVRDLVLGAGSRRVVVEPGLEEALVLASDRPAALREGLAQPARVRGAAWLARAAGAEAALVPGPGGHPWLLVVPGGGFVRPLPEEGVTAAALAPPGRWRPWTALGLGIAATLAAGTAGVLAGLRDQEVRELNRAPFEDTRPGIRALETGAWAAAGAALALALGGGGIGLWHLLDPGEPALRSLPPADGCDGGPGSAPPPR